MRIIVKEHDIEIPKGQKVNENEYKVTKCQFEFSEAYTDNLVKVAVFSNSAGAYKEYIINSECDIPAEILEKQETTLLGVYSYETNNDELILRYSPEPIKFYISKGSYIKDATNTEPITPTDKEQMEQMLANINIDAVKEGRITTIIYVNKDGEPHYVTLEDGKSIEYKWNGTYLGIRQEGQSEYEYVNLKGEKGDPGAIKIQIVVELPETGQDDTFYLVPYDEIIVNELPTTGLPDTIYVVSSTNKRYEYKVNQWVEIGSDNKYKEYVWINNDWEQIGAIGIQVDLTDYVKNTDYATSNKGGVFKTGFGIQALEGTIAGEAYTYNDYQGWRDLLVVSKGTLENVIAGKDLTTKAYVDGLVGDINTALDTINGEVI